MQRKRVALVTGASSGFGRSIAMTLLSNGFAVYGTSRKPKAAAHEGFRMLGLDVESDRSVAGCVTQVTKEAGTIDVLVNNAGYLSAGSLEESTVRGAKAQFETNFFGVVRMVNAILPIMRRRREGRIINISSIASSIPVPFQGFYAPSKAALTSYSEGLRMEVKSLGIKVSVIEPGLFKTNLFAAARSAPVRISDYGDASGKVKAKLAKVAANGGNPVMVAETVLRVINARSPRFRYAVGRDRQYLSVKRLVPEQLFESAKERYFGIGTGKRR